MIDGLKIRQDMISYLVWSHLVRGGVSKHTKDIIIKKGQKTALFAKSITDDVCILAAQIITDGVLEKQ